MGLGLRQRQGKRGETRPTAVTTSNNTETRPIIIKPWFTWVIHSCLAELERMDFIAILNLLMF